MKCSFCGCRTESSSGYCLTHKFQNKRGHKRAREESLLVEQVIPDKPGSVWCAWDKIGNVLAGPATTKLEVIMQLGDRNGEALAMDDDFAESA